MNAFIIVVLILIIVLVIYLASVYFNLNYLVRESTPLNIGSGTNTKMESIPSKELDSPASSRYNYSGWFFINSNFTKGGMENVLFNRGSNFVVSLKNSTLNIYAGAGNVPAVAIADPDPAVGTITPGTKKPLISIPNFPFQKWAFLVINVDGTTVDVYVDGKFASSIISPVAIGSDNTTAITYGNQYTQGNFCRFSREATTINPQTVWQKYMQGSGQGNSFSKTGIKLEILKNGKSKLNQQIF